MALKNFTTRLDNSGLSKNRPPRKLRKILTKRSGRNASGIITTHHQGGREKRFYRQIDWKRNKSELAKVISIEYDPNRTSNIALLQYTDGEKRYILAPDGVKVGQNIMSGETAPLTAGNALPLRAIPVGSLIHNIEVTPGRGGQFVRGAGTAAVVQGFEEKFALVKLPSGEIHRFPLEAYATLGQVDNVNWKNMIMGTAGRKRHMGVRPTVRGTAQNPRSHPHGGGEGRSGEGMHPKTPWGKSARGNRTRRKSKYSNKLIVSRRK